MEHSDNNSSYKKIAAERLLLQQIAEGSRPGFAILHQRYHPKLYQYILTFTGDAAVDAEEILQETFISIWEKRESLFTIQDFEAYMRKSVKNRILNKLKHQEFQQRLCKAVQDRSQKHVPQVDEQLQYNEYVKVAQEAISQLPEKRRLIFLCSTQEGMSLDDIAGSMQISKSRVKQQLYKATATIKAHLKKHAAWLLVLVQTFS